MKTICPMCSRLYDNHAKYCDIHGCRLILVNDDQIIFKKKEFRNLRHPTENSRIAIAFCVCLSVAIIIILGIFFSYGLLLVFFGVSIFSIWFSLNIAKASLVANSVKVSENNFPKIHRTLIEIKYILNYKKPIDIYIIQESTVNAVLAKFFQTKFIILNSGLVTKMLENGKIIQIKWIVARFIGALQAKHYRFTLLRLLINGIEKIKIFNLFILPYERATQYSGDQIGLAVCNDLVQAMKAFDKLLIGNELADKIEFKGLAEQAFEVRESFFATLARLFSTHPHMVNRYLNLLAFTRLRYPQMFEGYISQFDQSTTEDIKAILPNYAYKS